MLIDVIVFVLIAIAAFKGWRKGLIVGVFSFFALIVGLAAAIKLSSAAANYIGEAVTITQKWLPVISFIVVFIAVVILIRIGAKIIEGVVRIAMLGLANRAGGAILFILIYLLAFSVILFYAHQVNLIKDATIEASSTAAVIEPFGSKVIQALGKILPFFRDMFSDLMDFFENTNVNSTSAATVND